MDSHSADAQPAFGFKELFTYIVGDMAKAVCERNGESRQQQYVRSQAAVHVIMGFLPRDVIEAMLAGHCMMFHEVMNASFQDTLRGELDTMRHATRSNLCALNKAFSGNLDRLARYQLRPGEVRRDAPKAEPDTGIAERNVAAASATAAPAVVPAPVKPASAASPAAAPTAAAPTAAAPTAVAPMAAAPAATPSATAPLAPPSWATEPYDSCLDNPEALAAVMAGDHPGFLRAMGIELVSDEELIASGMDPAVLERTRFTSSPDAIAACMANPAAMACLEAGDAAGFARAMGYDEPSEDYLAAAHAEGSVFDRRTKELPTRGLPGSRKG